MLKKTNKLLTLLIISISGGIIYQVPYLKTVFYDPLQSALGVTHTQLGSLSSLYGIVAMILYIPGGIFADKFRIKYLYTISMISCGILIFWYATIPSFLALQIIHVLLAVFSILTFWSARLKVVRFLSDAENYPTNQGISNSIYAVAAMLSSFGALAFMSRKTDSIQNLKFALIFYGILHIVFGVLSYFTIPKFDDEINEGAKFNVDEMIIAIKTPGVWLVSISLFLVYAVHVSIPYTTPYLTNVYLAPVALISLISIIRNYGINIVSTPIAGAIAKKIGSTSNIVFIFCALIATLVSVFLFLPANSTLMVPIIILSLICAFFTTALNGLSIVQLEEVGVPKNIFGAATGLVSIIAYIPDVFLYTLYGSWLDKYEGRSGYNKIFIAVILFSLIGIFISGIITKYSKKVKSQKV
ncbi:MAG: MFS transporter [Acidaminococcaceae bacterium]|nr:MFS transporter [Acidaminococcaceae bacterium]